MTMRPVPIPAVSSFGWAGPHSPEFLAGIRSRYRHHAGSWGRCCPHKPMRSGMTVVPPPPCPDCVVSGDAALIQHESECGQFEFLLFKGVEVVVCLTCWRYGKPGQNHECSGDTSEDQPKDEYQDSLLRVVGIDPCPVCAGRCSKEASKYRCVRCKGLGYLDERNR